MEKDSIGGGNMIINTDLIYPIGAIYISVSATNPAILFGGKWEQIKDRFLLAAGDTYRAGSTGGEATHKLTINEMPAHTHGSKSLVGTWANWGEGSGQVSSTTNGYKVTGIVSAVGDNNQYGWGTATGRDNDNTSLKIDATHEHNSVGGGQAHNNMPPYLTVYMWKRVA